MTVIEIKSMVMIFFWFWEPSVSALRMSFKIFRKLSRSVGCLMPHQPHKEIGSNILILFTTCMLALSSSSFISALALLLSHCFLSLMRETGHGKYRAVEYWGSCSWNYLVNYANNFQNFCCKLVTVAAHNITALHEISVDDVRLLNWFQISIYRIQPHIVIVSCHFSSFYSNFYFSIPAIY